MAFKELSEKAILQLSQEKQIKYWKDFKAYYSEKKKKIQAKIREEKKQETARNKKKIDHATFVLFGAMIQHEGIKNFIAKMAENGNNNFSEKEKEGINLLMKSRNLKIKNGEEEEFILFK